MKYFLETIQRFEDGSEAKSISENGYETLSSAEKEFDYVMMSSIQNNNIIFVRCAVLNQIGGVEFQDSDLKPVTYEEGEEFENKYYVVRIITSTNGAVTAHDVFDYETEQDAKEAYYGFLYEATDVVGNGSVMCMIHDTSGNEIKRRYWPEAVE